MTEKVLLPIKRVDQVFVTPDLDQYYLPHEAGSKSWIIAEGATFDGDGNFIPLDLSGKKIQDGELVYKTGEDLAAEKEVEYIKLDEVYSDQRKAALMSFELTIFNPTTLTQAEQDNIFRVRQEWFDMTTQNNYPFDFVAPTLTPTL